MRIPARILLIAALAPLALGLAACKKGDDPAAEATPAVSATPLAKVAPPAGKAWSEVVDTTTDGGYRMGNPNAPIKLVEYGSLTCPHCAKFAQDGFAKLISEYVGSGRVSLEFRSFAIHPEDVPLTILANCGTKESFFPLVEQIYANFDSFIGGMYAQDVQAKVEQAKLLPDNQRFVAIAGAEGMTAFFAQRGISADQANACLADPAKAQAVAARAEEYGKAGIDSTPTLVLDGAKLNVPVGEEPWKVLEAAMQRAGAR